MHFGSLRSEVCRKALVPKSQVAGCLCVCFTIIYSMLFKQFCTFACSVEVLRTTLQWLINRIGHEIKASQSK